MKFRELICTIAASAWAVITHADAFASTQIGMVTSVSSLNGRVSTLGGIRTTPPACDCCGHRRIFINGAPRQALLSFVLLMAWRQGKGVSVAGNNASVATGNEAEGGSQAQIS